MEVKLCKENWSCGAGGECYETIFSVGYGNFSDDEWMRLGATNGSGGRIWEEEVR